MFSGSSSWFKSPFFEVGGIGFTKHLSETCGQFSMPMDKTARDRISTHMGAKLWANSFQTATLIFVMRLHVKKYI